MTKETTGPKLFEAVLKIILLITIFTLLISAYVTREYVIAITGFTAVIAMNSIELNKT